MIHQPKYVPARTNDGWSVAALVVLLTATLIATATYIHKKTYLHPTDTRFRAAYEDASSGSHE